MTAGNIIRPRGVSALDVMHEAAFQRGVEDYRANRPLADDLPPLTATRDSIGNRQRIYETGRIAAAFARVTRRKISAALLRQAKKEGALPR